jgi:hypothetical protein
MKKSVFTTEKSLTRWIILSGLLIGLLFSSGEGIRLFPFPFVSKADQKQSLLTGKSVQSYNLSTHGLSQQSFHQTSKLQKAFKFFSFHSVLTSGYYFAPVYLRFAAKQPFQIVIALALRRALLLPLAGRAPPLL